MKKLIISGVVILAVILLASISCAKPTGSTTTPAPVPTTGPSGESHAQYLFAPGRYFWPEPEWALPEPAFGEVSKDNPETLRPLTDEEKDRVVEIALSTPEAAEWREKGTKYRAELIWYTPQDPTAKDSRMLSYGYYKALYETYSKLYWRPGKLSKTAVWYPGVRIGFGEPQQFVVEVAVDLETGEVVYANSHSDVNRESNLRWLTDEEKNTVIKIALSAAEANGWLETEDEFRISLSWRALWAGGYRVFPYEAVVEGIPLYVPESESKDIYPNVHISLGEPAENVISVAVDLDTKEVVYDESYPNLSHPDRFPPQMLEINGIPAQEEYLPGQQVEIEFSFLNVYDEPVILPNPPEIWVLHPELPGRSEDWIIRSYPSGAEQLVIDKGETATYKFTWDQKDDIGRTVVPGYYYVRVVETPKSVLGKKGMPLASDFEVFLQYSQGAMEKTIEVNKSQTVSGVPLQREGVDLLTDLTVTLKRVELSAKRAQFYALATLPEYTWNSPTNYYPMNWMLADAEYTFNGITKDAGVADEKASKDGIWLMWGYVNPRDQVPKDAKELTFRILVSFDHPQEWYGPWEFNVPLE